MTLKVILEPGEDSGFIAHVPALRGCRSQGDTRDETLINIRQAVAAWLETAQDKAEYQATPTNVELITV